MKKILGYFQDKLGGMNLIKERYIFLCILSIFVVVILLFGSTYSLFNASNVDEDMHVYKTGNLNITYELSEPTMVLNNSNPTSIEDSVYIKPYRITVNNAGNVAYKFNLVLVEDTAINSINHDYIMTQVGLLDPVKLSSCNEGAIKEDIIIPAGDSVVIDVRVWLSDTVSNSEMGKSFYAKLSIDGIAVNNDHGDIDNSKLRASYQLLSEVEPGSYVKYIGNNGCGNTNCDGTNTSNGYCYDSNYKYNASGWRIAYIDSGSVYLISGGAPECMCTNSDGTTSNSSCSSYETATGFPLHLANLNTKSLNYCNAGFVVGGSCSSSSSWAFGTSDFATITGSDVNSCYDVPQNTNCGYKNGLIDINGRYWIRGVNSSKNFVYHWFVYASSVGYSFVGGVTAGSPNGVRPVIKLDPSVVIVDGTGTKSDPYVIENPNTIRDLSGNMNNGVPVGAVWDKKNDTVTTDGVDDYVNMGLKNYNFGNSVSFVARIKMNSLLSGDYNTIIANTEGAGIELDITPQSKFVFMINVNGTYYRYFSTFEVEVGEWNTVVGVYDGSNLFVYVNGNSVSLDTSNANSVSSVSGNIKVSSVPIYLAMNPSANGTIGGAVSNIVYDDVLIYDRALTSSEVTEYFSGEINGVSNEELLVHYDFKKMASHVYVDEARVESVTDGITSYYATLDDALNNASPSKTTNIKLLEDMTENININNNIENAVVDLNGKTLTGTIQNLNDNAKITLKNGTVTSSGVVTIYNKGEIVIESGNYYNTNTGTELNVIDNYGTLNIEDGTFSLDNEGTTIFNRAGASLIMNGGTVNLEYSGTTGQPIQNESGTVNLNNVTLTSKSYGFVNTGGTARIKNSTISTTSTSCWAVLNRSSGTTELMYNDVTGTNVYWNLGGTLSAFDSGDGNGKISGVVYAFSTSFSDGSSEVRIHGMSEAHVAVWTDKNGQDDLKWTTMSSYTGTYGTYLYYRIYKSTHNNETGTYHAHLYNPAHTTFYGSYTWTMN